MNRLTSSETPSSLVCFTAILLVLLGFATTVYAYEPHRDTSNKVLRWKSLPIAWELNPGGIKGISPQEVEAVFKRAFARWQSIKCSKATFVYCGLSQKFSKRDDNRNVVSFPPNFESQYGKGILFSTSTMFDRNGNLTDLDVALNPQINWAIGGNGQDLENVAMVVAGHILGLSSSKEKGSSMEGGSFLSGDISRRSLHPDDIAGAIFLYPAPGCSAQNQCANDQDCNSVDLLCQNNKCVVAQEAKPIANVCKPCNTAIDCGSGATCDLINSTTYCLQLCSPDGLCPKDYSCNGTGSNAQCLPSSGLCAASACQSDADCTGGFLCKQGKCQPECQVDSDCPSGNPRCLGGKCGKAGSCFRDFDCSAGEVCTNQQCVPSGKACSQDSECASGEKCVQGHCTLVTPCTTDNDCPANHVCKQSYCQRTASQCQDGQTQSCSCTGGQSGTQTCSSGQWGTCQCGSSTTCKPGDSQVCSCAGGKQGSQFCANDGSGWDPCLCDSGSCQAGDTQACSCSGGQTGTQTCDSNGQWGTCEKCQGGGNQACVPGSTQACACAGNQQGVQACASDGTRYETCQCNGTPVCTPGATQQCFCPGNTQGAQSCATDGTRWETCQCGTSTPPTDGGTDTGKCETHGQCPANQICVRGLCSSTNPNTGGCGCETNVPPPFTFWLWLGILSLCFLRLRRNSLG